MLEKRSLFSPDSKTQWFLLLGLLLGVVALVYGIINEAQRMWMNYLINSVYFVSMALGGTLVLSIAAVSSAAWLTPFKRIAESMSSFLPYGFILMLILFFGIHSIYEWSHHDVVVNDEILKLKMGYLNSTFFMIRIVVFFIIWIGATKMINYHSRKQDEDESVNHSKKIVHWSCFFLVTYALTYSLASFDWLMSLRPHWFSTIYGIYNFSGMFVGALAFITLFSIILQERGYLVDVISEDNYHDLGKLMFGFTTFWAYIWLCQYLLIWYSNIPEETVYYIAREENTWDWLFYFNFCLNWIIPFFALLPRSSKRSKYVLFRVAALLIIGRWLDIYLMSAPDIYEIAGIKNPSIGLMEIGMAIGFGCFFALVLINTLKKYPLVASKDPYLDEGLHLHQ